MQNTILQVPINKNTRNQAASRAEKMGFTSLQEVVRLFLNKIAAGEVNVTFEETVTLSDKNDKRCARMIEDVETGKVKTKTFTNTGSLMKYLNKF